MASPQRASFGHLLKRHRLAAGLTQEELAEQAGVSRRAIAALETGARRTPRKDTIALLAQALRLPPAEEALLVAAGRPRLPLSAHQKQGLVTSSADTAVQTNQTQTQVRYASPFVGRVAELTALGRHLAGDGPPLFLLAGEPGIGKSRLLDETATRARERGWTVLYGGCHRRSGQEPFAPLVGALTQFLYGRSPVQLRLDLQGCAWLVRLLPELAEHALVPAPTWTLPPEQERRLMFAAIARILSNIAGPAGTLVLLDDLQWADPDACDLLETLVRGEGATKSPLRLLGAYRSTEVDASPALVSLIADLARDDLASELSLAPFPPADSKELLTQVLVLADASLPDGVQERIVERAAGVPFFLMSLIRHAGSSDDERATPVPWTLQQSLRQRTVALPEEARRLLELMAVKDQEAPRATLLLAARVALAVAPTTVVAAIEAACKAGLLAEDKRGCYRYVHDLVREFVMGDLSAARRAALHLAWAETLERGTASGSQANAAALAWHFTAADQPARALPYTLVAGDKAEALFAHDEAERHYRTALDLARQIGDEATATIALHKLGEVLAIIARFDEALGCMRQVEEAYRRGGDVERHAAITARIGGIHARRATPQEGARHVRAALDRLTAIGLSEGGQAYLYLALAHLYKVDNDYPAMLDAAERACVLGPQSLDLRVVAGAQMRRGTALTMLGRDVEGRRVLEDVLPLLEEVRDLENLCHALNNLSVECETLEGDHVAARAYLDRGVSAAERLGDQSLLAFMLCRRGTNAFATGDWSAAATDLRRAVLINESCGDSWASANPPSAMALLLLAQGELEAASTYFQSAVAGAQRTGNRAVQLAVDARLAEAELLNGKIDQAWQRLSPLAGSESQVSEQVTLLPVVAWAYLARGDAATAQTVLARVIAHAEREGLAAAASNAQRMRALLLLERREWQAATEAIEQALALYRAITDSYGEAKALYVCGQLHTAKDEIEAAREKYQAALAICDRLGEGLYRPHIEQALKLASGSGDP